jgi:hypothetical protein
MGRIRGDAKGAADHLTDPLARPDLAPKAIGLGSTIQQSRQLGPLLEAQLRRAPRGWMRPQSFLHPFHTSALQPLAHGSSRDPQGSSDLRVFPARLSQFPGASPPSFAPVQPGF